LTREPRVQLAPLAGTLRPWLMLLIVCAGFSLHPRFLNTFWTADNLPNILQQAATTIILAVGMTFVIITGGIDLSVGSVMALCGVTLGLTVKQGPPPFLAGIMAIPAAVGAAALAVRLTGRRAAAWAASGTALVAAGLAISRAAAGGIQLEGAILAALAVGCACGLVNGLLVTLGRVPAFVATLGMYTAARGLTVFATDGNSVSGLPPRLFPVGQGAPLILTALAAVALGALVLNRTRSGRHLRAIGGSEEAARLAGVDVTVHKTLAYVVAGLCSALAAIVLTAKFRVADTGAGTGAELNAIAAVVIGGTSLSGGRGGVVGSLVGALTIAVLQAGLVLVAVPDTLQGVAIGGVIIATVMLDQCRRSPAAP